MTRRAYIWTHDIAGEQSGVIGRDFVDLYTDTTLDQDERLVFEIPANHSKVYLIGKDLELRFRGRSYFVGEISKQRQDTEVTVRVEAPALWLRLADLDYPGSLIITDSPPDDGGASILDGTGWTVGPRTVATGTFSMESQDRSALANIRTWAKITGTFVEFDTQARTVDWLASRGNDIGLAFRKGRNLRNVTRRETPPTITALLPYGRDNLTIAGVNGGSEVLEDLSFYTDQGITEDEARSRYGKRRVIRDQSFVKEADLYAWAQSKQATTSQPAEQIELDVVDISEISGVAESMQVGDRTRAFDPDFGDEFEAIITRFKSHPLRPWANVIELSTSPNLADDPDSSAGRDQLSTEWVQFVGPVRADYQIRSDGSYIVARIPLRFSEGRANYHLDLWATGVGAGDMIVTVVDTNADPEEQQFKQVVVPYTNNATVRATLQWAAEDLSGAKNYVVRVTTEASGGPSASNGVDIEADATDPAEASWWILAQGAVQETPVDVNSELFEYTGAVQYFTVPDNVTEITIAATGSGGGDGGAGVGGPGGIVTATFPVVPGTILDVVVGGMTGWPNGGDGGEVGGGTPGFPGGGSSDVRPTGSGFADALLVAPGGGGGGNPSALNPNPNGGAGGFYIGGDGADVSTLDGGGQGATQSAGGAGDPPSTNGAFNQGGAPIPSGNALVYGGGGGGGGWYGGGGGKTDLSPDQSGGGAGTGFIDLTRTPSDIEFQDGANSGDGTVLISWETPAF